MSAQTLLQHLRRSATYRAAGIALACMLPPLLAVALLAHVVAGATTASIVATIAVGGTLALVWQTLVRMDLHWLAHALDAAAPELEDSAALLLDGSNELSPLQQLQRRRLSDRIAFLALDLRPAWPRERLLVTSLFTGLMLALAAAWPPRADDRTDDGHRSESVAHVSDHTIEGAIEVAPPDYTHLPRRRTSELNVQAPEGSLLRWRLHLTPEPAKASLLFHDGTHLPLSREGDYWVSEQSFEASALYRVAFDSALPIAADPPYRLDVIRDHPPEVRALVPDRTLSLFDGQQQSWELVFEVHDDYGLDHAELTITHAQGTGEHIAFNEQTIPLNGVGTSITNQQYRYALDLAALGIEKGDDVIARLIVADNRQPDPNIARSPGYILRWTVEAATGRVDLNSMAQEIVPAYLRSQRQIIMDTEALLANEPSRDGKVFLDRSDAIGVDQKILRLRYGQFLGEEAAEPSSQHKEHEHHAPHRPAPPSFNRILHDPAKENQKDALSELHDAHADGSPGSSPTFGDEGDIVAQHGHLHDIAEAATLFDPETKEIVRSALAEMWRSELYLRQGLPEDALPYEYRALDYIKRIQQASRIHLDRVGLRLPAPDESRRLSGDRRELTDRIGSLSAAQRDTQPIADLVRDLDRPGFPNWDEAVRWIDGYQDRIPDRLGLLSAIDRVRHEPHCAACRATLKSLLWPLTAPPPAAVWVRSPPDAAGAAYLDALHAAEQTPTPPPE